MSVLTRHHVCFTLLFLLCALHTKIFKAGAQLEGVARVCMGADIDYDRCMYDRLEGDARENAKHNLLMNSLAGI